MANPTDNTIARIERQLLSTNGRRERDNGYVGYEVAETDLRSLLSTAQQTEELRGALRIFTEGNADVGDTAIIIGDGASAKLRKARAALAHTVEIKPDA